MKQSSHKRSHAVFAVGAIVVISALISVIYWQSLPNHRQDVHSDSSVLGTATEANRYTLTASDLSVGSTDPNSQTKHVSLKVVINNIGNETLQIAPGLQMQLSDTTGAISYATAKYLSADKTVGGPVPGSSSSVMNVDFEIGGNAQPKQFIFQPDLKSKPLTIGL
jgi:hypothetical protein